MLPEDRLGSSTQPSSALTAEVGGHSLSAAEPRGHWRAERAAGDSSRGVWLPCEHQSGGSKDPQGRQRQSAPHLSAPLATPARVGGTLESPGAAAPLPPGPAMSLPWGQAPTPLPRHLLPTVGTPDPGQHTSEPCTTAVRPGGQARPPGGPDVLCAPGPCVRWGHMKTAHLF